MIILMITYLIFLFTVPYIGLCCYHFIGRCTYMLIFFNIINSSGNFALHVSVTFMTTNPLRGVLSHNKNPRWWISPCLQQFSHLIHRTCLIPHLIQLYLYNYTYSAQSNAAFNFNNNMQKKNRSLTIVFVKCDID